MKLRSGKELIYSEGEKYELLDEVKTIIEKKLEELKEITSEISYKDVVKQLLTIHTEKVPFNTVLKNIQDNKDYIDPSVGENSFDCLYSLSKIIEGTSVILSNAYYDYGYNTNIELRIEVTGEIYDFIQNSGNLNE